MNNYKEQLEKLLQTNEKLFAKIHYHFLRNHKFVGMHLFEITEGKKLNPGFKISEKWFEAFMTYYNGWEAAISYNNESWPLDEPDNGLPF